MKINQRNKSPLFGILWPKDCGCPQPPRVETHVPACNWAEDCLSCIFWQESGELENLARAVDLDKQHTEQKLESIRHENHQLQTQLEELKHLDQIEVSRDWNGVHVPRGFTSGCVSFHRRPFGRGFTCVSLYFSVRPSGPTELVVLQLASHESTRQSAELCIPWGVVPVNL